MWWWESLQLWLMIPTLCVRGGKAGKPPPLLYAHVILFNLPAQQHPGHFHKQSHHSKADRSVGLVAILQGLSLFVGVFVSVRER